MAGVRTIESLVKSEDLFSGLNPENKQIKDKQIEITQRKQLESIVKKFDNLLKRRVQLINFYALLDEIKYLDYTGKDITDFSILLKKYEKIENFEYISGVFLSSLVHHSNEETIKINTKGLTLFPGRIGSHNNKNIIINGNCGNFLGCYMENGKITLNGDAEDSVGYLSLGGKIYLNGEFDSISESSNSKIYHKGRRIK